MKASPLDQWSDWLLHRRFGGDPQQMRSVVAQLAPIRDTVLHHAALAEGETLLDVGCGDGLIAFGALDTTTTSQVIFSDISEDILDHAQTLAEQMQLLHRCRFLRAAADDLDALPDAAVDVVTTRSVLIYVAAKQQAFDEFWRVLKPGGRLSIFEPINRMFYPEPAQLYRGYDVTPVQQLAEKVKATYQRIQPPATSPLLDFDERDLLVFAERAGFSAIDLELKVTITPLADDLPWATFLRIAPNPLAPTLEETMQQALTPAEAEQFSGHLRPLVEAKRGIRKSAVAYLWAVKS